MDNYRELIFRCDTGFGHLPIKKTSWATRGSANAYGGGIEPLLPSVKDLISIRIPRDEWKNIQ